MTTSSKNASANMIPPQSACCEGPVVTERRGYTGSIAVNWEGCPEAETIAKNMNEVEWRAIRDADPLIKPDSTDVHPGVAASAEELK